MTDRGITSEELPAVVLPACLSTPSCDTCSTNCKPNSHTAPCVHMLTPRRFSPCSQSVPDAHNMFDKKGLMHICLHQGVSAPARCTHTHQTCQHIRQTAPCTARSCPTHTRPIGQTAAVQPHRGSCAVGSQPDHLQALLATTAPCQEKGLTTLSCWPHQEQEAHHCWVHAPLQLRPQQRLPALLPAVGRVPAAAAAVPC